MAQAIATGIHPTAVVDPGARIGAGVGIGAAGGKAVDGLAAKALNGHFQRLLLLLGQHGRIEIVVVDDGSTDDTFEEMQTLLETLPIGVFIALLFEEARSLLVGQRTGGPAHPARTIHRAVDEHDPLAAEIPPVTSEDARRQRDRGEHRSEEVG